MQREAPWAPPRKALKALSECSIGAIVSMDKTVALRLCIGWRNAELLLGSFPGDGYSCMLKQGG